MAVARPFVLWFGNSGRPMVGAPFTLHHGDQSGLTLVIASDWSWASRTNEKASDLRFHAQDWSIL